MGKKNSGSYYPFNIIWIYDFKIEINMELENLTSSSISAPTFLQYIGEACRQGKILSWRHVDRLAAIKFKQQN